MPTNRRELLKLLGTSAVLSAAGVTIPRTATSAAAESSARAAFAFDEQHVPMNAANLCPSPRRVAEAVSRYTAMIDSDPSFQNRDQFAALTEQSRSAVASQLGVSPTEIALVRNTSEANGIISAGLDLAPGDEVLLWSQNHPSNDVAWTVRAARAGFRVRHVSVPDSPRDQDELIAAFTKAMSKKTRVLSVTHISNVTGLRLPIEALGAICNERGIHFHIDGAQTWGAMATDLCGIGCDSFSASAHKWFLGPKEVGMLYVRESAVERIWPSVVSYGWGADEESDLQGARKFESMGQRDDAALAAVAEAARLHEDLGPSNIEDHITSLATRLKEGMLEVGLSLVTPLDPELSGGVCIARVADSDQEPLFNSLYEEHGIIGAPTGGLRLCPHIYNTVEHVDRAVDGIRAYYSRNSLPRSV